MPPGGGVARFLFALCSTEKKKKKKNFSFFFFRRLMERCSQRCLCCLCWRSLLLPRRTLWTMTLSCRRRSRATARMSHCRLHRAISSAFFPTVRTLRSITTCSPSTPGARQEVNLLVPFSYERRDDDNNEDQGFECGPDIRLLIDGEVVAHTEAAGGNYPQRGNAHFKVKVSLTSNGITHAIRVAVPRQRRVRHL
jgi:hypothetical protein